MANSFSYGGGGAVTLDGLDQLINKLEAAEQGSRLEPVLNELGEQMKAQMDSYIGNHKTLQDAQQVIVKIRDTGGGYVAIKPKLTGYKLAGKSKYKGKALKAWDLTRFTNDGHAIRKPKVASKNYRPRIKVPYVSGKGYYDKTRKWAESAAITAMNKLADEMAGDLV